MYMRLAFSIATTLDPEILLVDEILAVGDEGFQRKCLDRMTELRRQCKAIVFVSHNLSAIRDLCSRVIWRIRVASKGMVIRGRWWTNTWRAPMPRKGRAWGRA